MLCFARPSSCRAADGVWAHGHTVVDQASAIRRRVQGVAVFTNSWAGFPYPVVEPSQARRRDGICFIGPLRWGGPTVLVDSEPVDICSIQALQAGQFAPHAGRVQSVLCLIQAQMRNQAVLNRAVRIVRTKSPAFLQLPGAHTPSAHWLIL